MDISLNQGVKFKKYQSRIKKSIEKKENFKKDKHNRESFVNIFEENAKNVANADQQNLTDSMDLHRLENQLNSLMKQYTDLEKTAETSSRDLLARYGPNNPYKGQNVRFQSNGAVGYVTDLGKYKWYNADAIDATAGKNGCPAMPQWSDPSLWNNDPYNLPGDISGVSTGFNTPGTVFGTNPSLQVGTSMISGQSCGNEGKNVYANKMVNNPVSSYIGCYNDKPPVKTVNIVPQMGSSNSINGFNAYASSIYQDNNGFAGPWCAFDQNPDTWWHSSVSSGYTYNASTGIYEGYNSVQFNTPDGGTQTASGERLQIDMPGIHTSSEQNYTLTSYDILGRQGCCGDPNGRHPNTWYILGYTNGQWYQVDYKENQNYGDTVQTYSVDNPGPYSSYLFVTIICGDQNDRSGNRYCVQIATWNLYSSSNYSVDDSDRAMIWNPNAIGYTSLESCKTYAADNGYKYFSMQDFQPDGLTAACLVSNDITRIKMYGDGSSIRSGIPIWASNTAGTGASSCWPQQNGVLLVTDSSGTNIIWQSPAENAPASCWWGGKINPDGLTATYGANCNNSGYNVASGNSTDKVKQTLTDSGYPSQLSFPINNGNLGDPAVGCPKSWDTSYQCGNVWKSAHIDYAEGQNYIYDCNDTANTCVFFLILQTDGNLCLYKGADPSNITGNVWCAMTNGQAKDPNPDWVASKGKYGREYMKMGEYLGPDEWIGSIDGSLKLIMQTDGNLVLYTSTLVPGCNQGNDGQQYGGPLINAVYELDQVGDRNSIGKVGYVDADANLKEYPTSMLGKSNQYDIYDGYDTWGNDLSIIENVANMNACEDLCNANSECSAFVWQPAHNKCFLKNSNAFPVGERQAEIGITLGVRRPIINNDSSCSKELTDIDSSQYYNYLKGDPMTSTTSCGVDIVSPQIQQQLFDLENQMNDVANQIASKINTSSSSNIDLNNQMNSGKQNMNNDMKKYIEIKAKMAQILGKKIKIKNKNTNNIGQNNMIETLMNMQDLNAMITDTDLTVLQNNSQYILWSILALGSVIATVNILKK